VVDFLTHTVYSLMKWFTVSPSLGYLAKTVLSQGNYAMQSVSAYTD